MNHLINSETRVKALTDVCEDVCTFMKSIAADNTSKDEQIDSLKVEIDECQSQCSDLKTQLNRIREQIKTLGGLLCVTIDRDDSTVDVLTRLIASLSPDNNNAGNVKKRKLFSSYSPLKLSLKDKTESNESTVTKRDCSKLEKENKLSLQNKTSNVWKLRIKVDGKPSDLLKKSKQTTLNLQPRNDKVDLDITTFVSPTSKAPILNSTTFNREAPCFKTNDSDKITCIDDSPNSLSHFNKIIKPTKRVIEMVKPGTSRGQTVEDDQSSDESACSPIIIPMNVIQNGMSSEQQNKNSSRNVLNSCDVKLGLNDVQNDLLGYNFKENPGRKRNGTFERNLVKPSTKPEQNDSSSDKTVYSPMNVIQNKISPKKLNKNSNKNVLNNCDIKLDLSDVQNDLPNYNFKEDPVRKRNERKLLNGWDCEDCRKFYKANNDNPVEAKNAMNHFSRHRSVKHQHHAPTPPGFWDPT